MADKKKKLKRQVSNDGGRTWQDMIPYEYIAGELIERDSPDCNNVEWRTVSGYICEENTTEMTQWVADTGYVCVGFDKYNKEKEQVSYNSGISWADTGNTRAGSTLIEANSTDCGYIPTIKATLTYQNGDTYNILENGSSILTDSEVRRDISDTSDVHHYTKITGVVVYDTVDALAGSFESCTNLASVTLPSTPLEIYGNTFIYCESLGNITLGNNITLDNGGSNIFAHCTSLTNITIPSSIKRLPYGFLSFCENLKTVTIEATDFEMFYDNVFFDCESLESITLKATTPPAFGYNMLHNVPTNVKIYVPCASLNAYKTASGWSAYADRIQCEEDYSTQYLTTEALGNGNISLKKNNESKIPLSNIQYSKNDSAWTSYTYGTQISVVNGDKIKWKATWNDGNDLSLYTKSYSYFNTSSAFNIKVYGNPISLLVNDNFADVTDISSFNAAFSYLFHILLGRLTDASNLSLVATTLSPDCYHSMFFGDGYLTTAPALPATTLSEGCYESMFSGCSSLTSAPVLPATTLASRCYDSMFDFCRRLTNMPALNATTLAFRCYDSMFGGCTSLTTAPVLPATTLAESCYSGMFSGCSSLATAPALPATTLAEFCYSGMFSGCSSLKSAPVLPATALAPSCYFGMFKGCTNLATAPVLPATTLTDYCYQYMFEGCTSLTAAPVLPAATLTTHCYYYMFSGCTSLNSVSCCATDISANECTSDWLSGVSSTGTFTKASGVTWSSGSSGIPSGWTIVDAT